MTSQTVPYGTTVSAETVCVCVYIGPSERAVCIDLNTETTPYGLTGQDTQKTEGLIPAG